MTIFDKHRHVSSRDRWLKSGQNFYRRFEIRYGSLIAATLRHRPVLTSSQTYQVATDLLCLIAAGMKSAPERPRSAP